MSAMISKKDTNIQFNSSQQKSLFFESIDILLKKAMKYIPLNRIWVNPDCGLKTRNWKETVSALKNMVEASKKIRNKIKKNI